MHVKIFGITTLWLHDEFTSLKSCKGSNAAYLYETKRKNNNNQREERNIFKMRQGVRQRDKDCRKEDSFLKRDRMA